MAASNTLVPIDLNVDVGRALRPSKAKLTPAKRKKFLQVYAETANFTAAAQAAGATRARFYQLLDSDEKFAAAFKTVEDALLDRIEEVRLTVAIQPSRDGHQDAKMLLKAKRPEIYGDKLQVNATHLVKVEHTIPELNRILLQNGMAKADKPEEIPFVELPTETEQSSAK